MDSAGSSAVSSAGLAWATGLAGVAGFETLTFAPIDRRLIEVSMLSADERTWVDDYHAKVLEVVGPRLESEVLAWLEAQCAPL